MRINIPLPWMRRPYYQAVFKGGPLDRAMFEWEGLTPPDEQWVRLWTSLEEFAGGAGDGSFAPQEDADATRVLYQLESRHPHTMHHDRPMWRYVFAGIVRGSGTA